MKSRKKQVYTRKWNNRLRHKRLTVIRSTNLHVQGFSEFERHYGLIVKNPTKDMIGKGFKGYLGQPFENGVEKDIMTQRREVYLLTLFAMFYTWLRAPYGQPYIGNRHRPYWKKHCDWFFGLPDKEFFDIHAMQKHRNRLLDEWCKAMPGVQPFTRPYPCVLPKMVEFDFAELLKETVEENSPGSAFISGGRHPKPNEPKMQKATLPKGYTAPLDVLLNASVDHLVNPPPRPIKKYGEDSWENKFPRAGSHEDIIKSVLGEGSIPWKPEVAPPLPPGRLESGLFRKHIFAGYSIKNADPEPGEKPLIEKLIGGDLMERTEIIDLLTWIGVQTDLGFGLTALERPDGVKMHGYVTDIFFPMLVALGTKQASSASLSPAEDIVGVVVKTVLGVDMPAGHRELKDISGKAVGYCDVDIAGNINYMVPNIAGMMCLIIIGEGDLALEAILNISMKEK